MIWGLNFCGGAYFPYTSRLSQEHTQPPVQWLLGPFSRVKWPGQCINQSTSSSVGWDNLVWIATRYKLDSPGIKSRWRWDLTHPSRLDLWPTLPPVQWVQYLIPEVEWPGHSAEHQPHLALKLKKEQRYTSTPPVGLHGLFYGELYLTFTSISQ